MTAFASVRLGPSFARVLWHIAISIVALVVTLFLIDIILGKDPIGNMLKHWSYEESLTMVLAVVVILLFAAALYATSYRFSVLVSKEQISGRTEGGRRIEFPTNSVSSVVYRPNRYAPGLIISSELAEQRIFMLTIGLDKGRLCAELQTSIGQSHLLTIWFSENAA